MAVTLNEIAEAAGVSRGTVDRALNNRGRIKPEVAERIRKIAQEMGYSINVSGRALAMTGRHIVLGVIVQFAETPFLKMMLEGVRAAAEEFSQFGCRVEICEIRGVDTDALLKSIEGLRRKEVRSIAIAAVNNSRIRNEIDKCIEDGIEIITLNFDIPGTKRTCFVGQDAKKSGQMAAGIMGDLLQGNGKIAVISGVEDSIQSDRVLGFRGVMEQNYENIRIVADRLTGNRPEALREQLQEVVDEYRDLDGIYLCAEGAAELASCLRERHLDQQCRVIVHDLEGCRREDIETRAIDYVIDDDAYGQGYLAVRLLFMWFYHQKKPDREFYHTDIRIISRYNLQNQSGADSPERIPDVFVNKW